MIPWTILVLFFLFSILYFLYQIIRPWFKYKVNCWFCNTNTWVHLPYVNSFLCPSCRQYNGFREDGDYNQSLNAQFYEPTQPQRYCIPSSLPGTVNCLRNGLCDVCNQNQQLIVERLNKFEPIDEDNYYGELEQYKQSLNKAYPLCNRCETFTAKKLLDVQAKFSTPQRRLKSMKSMSTALSIVAKTASMPGSVKGSIAGSIFGEETQQHARASKQHDHTGKQMFACGFITNALNITNLAFALFMFLACIEKLQMKADRTFVLLEKWMPNSLVVILSSVHENMSSIALWGFLFHLFGVNRSKARFTFNDLLAYPSWVLLVGLSWHSEPSDDRLLGQFGMVSFLILISAALVLIPKKRKHRKRPNTILSAFSVASTPPSQCSSRCSTIATHYRSPKEPTTWLEQMDTLEKDSSRESTPSRELGNKLFGLTLNEGVNENRYISMISPGAVSPSRFQKRQAPFSSLTYNSFAQKKLNGYVQPTKASSTTSLFSTNSTTTSSSMFESKLAF